MRIWLAGSVYIRRRPRLLPTHWTIKIYKPNSLLSHFSAQLLLYTLRQKGKNHFRCSSYTFLVIAEEQGSSLSVLVLENRYGAFSMYVEG
jgi:hypothetical protein